MLAMEMKASGIYVARGLSYKDAEFSTIEADLTPEQEKMYDIAAHLWWGSTVYLKSFVSIICVNDCVTFDESSQILTTCR